jgi:hypothetical protein
MFKVRTYSIGLMLSLVAVLLLTISAASAQEEATKLGGTVTVRDDGANLSAKLITALSELPTPAAGTAYEGWLVGTGGKVSVGVLVVAVDGSADQEYIDPDGANLLAKYSAYAITSEPSPDPDPATSGDVLYADSIPGDASGHVGHLLVALPANPDGKGIAVGLREQAAAALAHAQLAEASTTLAGQQDHAQHVINIVEGTGGANFDSSAANPGDGNGILTYADDLVAHATLAKAGLSATDDADVIAAADAAIANANDAKTGAEQARNNAVSLLSATVSDSTSDLQVQNMHIGLSNGSGSAVLAYGNAQDLAIYVPILGATPVTPPAVGDGLVATIAMSVLFMGLMATAAGAFLLFRRKPVLLA